MSGSSDFIEDTAAVKVEGPQCPVPLRDYPQVILGHGGGGKLSAELIENVFTPAFENEHVTALTDSTLVPVSGQRIAMTTDSYVVQPLFFPGGCIGDLAVNGTVNDLCMSGAQPRYLTAGFILEEGFEIMTLIRIAQKMGQAASRAGVAIVAGDTKVVQRGHGDGCYINTSGIGIVPKGQSLSAASIQPGDVVVVSGSIGDHGMAIMSVREGLEFESPIRSDSAALNGLTEAMLTACPSIRMMRDPTRGGVATSLNEIAESCGHGIEIEHDALPINDAVASACEFLGLDPLFVANEGKLIAIVPHQDAGGLLETMRSHPLGKQSAIIGCVIPDEHHLVVARTPVGVTRVVTVPIGEQLPRIC